MKMDRSERARYYILQKAHNHYKTNRRRFFMSTIKAFLSGIAAVGLLAGITCTSNPADPGADNSTGTVTDIDGNVYATVKIGNQVWMAENLRVTKYTDGSAIPFDTSTTTWSYDTTPKYCFYKNTTDSDSLKKYGALYNWYVVSPTNLKKIAPRGWHVPTDAEWDTLLNYMVANGYNWDGTLTDNKIAKSLAAKTDWITGSTPGTPGCDLTLNNRSGFSALPGGCRLYYGPFDYQSSVGTWWSATGFGTLNALCRNLNCDYVNLYGDGSNKSCGVSVRLVRNWFFLF
jgi:uncharacterized protein (TIGR02145 family)